MSKIILRKCAAFDFTNFRISRGFLKLTKHFVYFGALTQNRSERLKRASLLDNVLDNNFLSTKVENNKKIQGLVKIPQIISKLELK